MSHLIVLMLEQWSRVYPLKAFSCSGPHYWGPLPDPAVALNKGLAISEKPSIQNQQNPAAPRNSWTSFLVFSWGIEQMACFLSRPSTRCPFEMTNPKYLTSCLQIRAFFHDTLYPVVESRASSGSLGSPAVPLGGTGEQQVITY